MAENEITNASDSSSQEGASTPNKSTLSGVDLNDPVIQQFLNSGVKQSGQADQKSSESNLDGVDTSDPVIQKFFGKEPAKNVGPTPTDEYEQRIQSHMPEAQKEAKEAGYTGAVTTGAKEAFLLGPAYKEISADIQAAAGYGKGETFAQRRQDIKAQQEAAHRASGELYPKTQLAAEIGSSIIPGIVADVATEGAATPMLVGNIGSRVAAGAEALGAGSKVAKVIGSGTEAAALGAGSAAEEKLIGTKPEAEQPGIGTSAIVGGALGVAVPVAGSAIGKTFDAMAPDWAQSYMSKFLGDNYFLNQLNKKAELDKAAGENVLDVADAISKKQANPDFEFTPFDIGGTRAQSFITKTFKNRNEELDNFSNFFSQRMDGVSDRFTNALKDVSGITGDLDLNRLAQESKDYATQMNQAAYSAAHQRNNGKGTWNPKWEEQFNYDRVKPVIDQVNQDMADIYGGNFIPPINRTGSQSVDILNLSPQTKDFLRLNNINTLDELAVQKNNKFSDIFNQPVASGIGNDGMLARRALSVTGMPESAISKLSDSAAVDLAKMNELSLLPGKVPLPQEGQRILNEVTSAIKNKDLDRLTLTNPDSMNVQWLNRYQQGLQNLKNNLASQNTSQNMPFIDKLEKYKQQIVGGLKGATNNDGSVNTNFNPNTYNLAFDIAHRQAAQTFRAKGAFDLGRDFASQLGSGQSATAMTASTQAMNATEHQMFAQGILAQVNYLANKTGQFNYNLVNRYMNNPEVKKSLTNALGVPKFEKLQAVLMAENIGRQSFDRAKQLVARSGGSPQGLFYSKDLPSLALGYLFDTKLGFAGYLYNHVISPVMGRKYATQVKNMLDSGDLTEMHNVYTKLMNNPKTKQGILDTVARLMYSNLATARLPTTYHTQGGLQGAAMTGKKDGGSVSDEPHPASMIPGFHDYIERTKRATGGRIPHADKLFNEAKKTLDNQTKPMLNVHDDAIVHALRIAQGRV